MSAAEATTTEAISVVIPAYHEEGAVGVTVAEIRAVLAREGIAAEILVVDDGSRDGTAAAAEAAGARVLRHPHNLGYGRSLKDGIAAAVNDTIVICDADGSYGVESLPALLAEHRRGFDLVVGARQSYRDAWPKAILRWVLKSLVELTAGRRVVDVNSGLRVFSKRQVTPFFRHLSDTFSFTTSQTLAYMMSKRFVAYLPVAYRARLGTSKVRLLRDSLRTLQYIVQAILIYNPIKLFLALATLPAALGVLCLGLGIAVPWREGPLAAVLCGLASLLLIGLGFVADLLRMLLGPRE